MTAAIACPVCLDDQPEPFWEHDRITCVRCQACRTVYMSPLPTARQVQAIYDNAYADATTGYFLKIESKLKRARRRMRFMRRLVDGGRFLDIGCSGGFTVEAAREQGFDAVGIDIDPVAIRYAREHYPANRFAFGPIDEFNDDDGFDAVYCSEVIEHVPRVRDFITAVARWLNPGGTLYITTPDITHWNRPRRLCDWDGFCPPSHCIYFSPDSLRQLLREHALRVFHTKFAWKPGIKMLARRDRWPTIGARCGNSGCSGGHGPLTSVGYAAKI